jgi:hypothetical protein
MSVVLGAGLDFYERTSKKHLLVTALKIVSGRKGCCIVVHYIQEPRFVSFLRTCIKS